MGLKVRFTNAKIFFLLAFIPIWATIIRFIIKYTFPSYHIYKLKCLARYRSPYEFKALNNIARRVILLFQYNYNYILDQIKTWVKKLLAL